MTEAIRPGGALSMALRLSSPGSIKEEPSRRAERLAARAQASLLARDFKGYRALFEEAAAIDDVHRRYQARKQILEQGLSAAVTGPRGDIAQTYLTVARATV